MAKTVELNSVTVEWVQFRLPKDDSPPSLEAFGTLTNDAGDAIPRRVIGWDGVSSETMAAVVESLRQLLFERAALELDAMPDALTLEGGVIRETVEEQP
jgi:hypothetical protein